MGMGIAITGALRANKKMVVMDSNGAALDQSMTFAQKWLNGQVAKSKLNNAVIHKNHSIKSAVAISRECKTRSGEHAEYHCHHTGLSIMELSMFSMI